MERIRHALKCVLEKVPLFASSIAQRKGVSKDGPEAFLRVLFVTVALSPCTWLFDDLSRRIPVPPVPAEKTVLNKKQKSCCLNGRRSLLAAVLFAVIFWNGCRNFFKKRKSLKTLWIRQEKRKCVFLCQKEVNERWERTPVSGLGG